MIRLNYIKVFVFLVVSELQDIHVKLLRKLKRSVNPEKWEKAIIKFCYFYGGSDDGKKDFISLITFHNFRFFKLSKSSATVISIQAWE